MSVWPSSALLAIATCQSRVQDDWTALHAAAATGATTAVYSLVTVLGPEYSVDVVATVSAPPGGPPSPSRAVFPHNLGCALQNQMTPLFLAVQGDHVSTARALLSSGADANRPVLFPGQHWHDPLVPTRCLNFAVSHGRTDMVQVLVAAGASADIADTVTGLRPVAAVLSGEYEASQPHRHMLATLISAASPVKSPGRAASASTPPVRSPLPRPPV